MKGGEFFMTVKYCFCIHCFVHDSILTASLFCRKVLGVFGNEKSERIFVGASEIRHCRFFLFFSF